MRKKIVAGNWKMYKTLQEAESTIAAIANGLSKINTEAEIWIAPPLPFIDRMIYRFGNTQIKFGAQNLNENEDGAFTGEVSAKMLQSIGCYFVIIGHSERRQYYNEIDIWLQKKIQAASKNNLIALYCCGETLQQRNDNSHFTIIQSQIKEALFNLSDAEINNTVIAYEPVWAIGTGVNATAGQAQEMHAYIRMQIAGKFGTAVAQNMRILYGGSVKPANASELFLQPDIDGGLIGGASLLAADFIKIIESVR